MADDTDERVTERLRPAGGHRRVGEFDRARQDSDDRLKEIEVPDTEDIGFGRIDFDQTDRSAAPDDRHREPGPDSLAGPGPADDVAARVEVADQGRL